MQLLWWPFFTTFPHLEKDGRPDGTRGGIVAGPARDLKQQQGNRGKRSSGFILVFGIFFVATQSVFLSRLIHTNSCCEKREGDCRAPLFTVA